jgi:cation-transporting ATPase 13A2
VILWYTEDYSLYACCILLISTISVVTSLHETKKNIKSIANMSHYICDVSVYRESSEYEISDAQMNIGF